MNASHLYPFHTRSPPHTQNLSISLSPGVCSSSAQQRVATNRLAARVDQWEWSARSSLPPSSPSPRLRPARRATGGAADGRARRVAAIGGGGSHRRQISSRPPPLPTDPPTAASDAAPPLSQGVLSLAGASAATPCRRLAAPFPQRAAPYLGGRRLNCGALAPPSPWSAVPFPRRSAAHGGGALVSSAPTSGGAGDLVFIFYFLDDFASFLLDL